MNRTSKSFISNRSFKRRCRFKDDRKLTKNDKMYVHDVLILNYSTINSRLSQKLTRKDIEKTSK